MVSSNPAWNQTFSQSAATNSLTHQLFFETTDNTLLLFLGSTSKTMSIKALPAVLLHLCLITIRRIARAPTDCPGNSSLLEVKSACNVREVAAGTIVLSQSEKYANFSHAQLCQEIAHRDMEMTQMRDRLHKKLKRTRYWKNKCSDGQEALEQKNKKIGHFHRILNLREGERMSP